MDKRGQMETAPQRLGRTAKQAICAFTPVLVLGESVVRTEWEPARKQIHPRLGQSRAKAATG